MLTERGPLPVGKSTLGSKVMLGLIPLLMVVLSRMETSLLKMFATAKSGFPSPLMSSMLTDLGPAPVVKGTWGAKVGVGSPVPVVLTRRETLSLPVFVVAKSGFMSPLKSPMLTELGKLPVAKSNLGAKVGGVLSRMET